MMRIAGINFIVRCMCSSADAAEQTDVAPIPAEQTNVAPTPALLTGSSQPHIYPFGENLHSISNLVDDYIKLDFLTKDLKSDSEEAKRIKFLRKEVNSFSKRMPNAQNKLIESIFMNIIDNFRKLNLTDEVREMVEKKTNEILDGMYVMVAPLQTAVDNMKTNSIVTFKEKSRRERAKGWFIYSAEAKKLRDHILPNIFFLYGISKEASKIQFNTAAEIEYSLSFLNHLSQAMCNWESIARGELLKESWRFCSFNDFYDEKVTKLADGEDLSKYIKESEVGMYSLANKFIKKHLDTGKAGLKDIAQNLVMTLYLLNNKVQTEEQESILIDKLEELLKSGAEIDDRIEDEIPVKTEISENIKKAAEILIDAYEKNRFELPDLILDPEDPKTFLQDWVKLHESYNKTESMISITHNLGLVLVGVCIILFGIYMALGGAVF